MTPSYSSHYDFSPFTPLLYTNKGDLMLTYDKVQENGGYQLKLNFADFLHTADGLQQNHSKQCSMQ